MPTTLRPQEWQTSASSGISLQHSGHVFIENVAETLRGQLSTRYDEETAAKLLDFARQNGEVLWQWKNARRFGPRPAMRCLEYALLDFPEPIIGVNYAALMYVGLRDLEKRELIHMGEQERGYLKTVLNQMGNAACAIPFPEAAAFAVTQLRELGLPRPGP